MHQATADATASEKATTAGAMIKNQTRIASAATPPHTAPKRSDREAGLVTSATNRSLINTAYELPPENRPRSASRVPERGDLRFKDFFRKFSGNTLVVFSTLVGRDVACNCPFVLWPVR